MHHLLLLLAVLSVTLAEAPVALDAGTSFLRLAHYNPHSIEGIDLVLSNEGDRHFASVVGFSQDEPLFGDEANSLSQRRPERTVPHLPRLLSFKYCGVACNLYRQDFPRVPLVGLPSDDIGVDAGWDHTPSIMELYSLMLRSALANARAQLNLGLAPEDAIPIIAVSRLGTSMHQMELAVQAAEAAGAFVVTTISNGAAAGVDWAERQLKRGEEAHVLVVDIGTLGSTAALIHATRAAAGRLKLSVVASALDDSLGGASRR